MTIIDDDDPILNMSAVYIVHNLCSIPVFTARPTCVCFLPAPSQHLVPKCSVTRHTNAALKSLALTVDPDSGNGKGLSSLPKAKYADERHLFLYSFLFSINSSNNHMYILLLL